VVLLLAALYRLAVLAEAAVQIFVVLALIFALRTDDTCLAAV
jgi:hypothetical protein